MYIHSKFWNFTHVYTWYFVYTWKTSQDLLHFLTRMADFARISARRQVDDTMLLGGLVEITPRHKDTMSYPASFEDLFDNV